MKKPSKKRKEWLDSHSRKVLLKMSRTSKKGRFQSIRSLKKKKYNLDAPPVLSLFDAPESTLLFFSEALSTAKKCELNDTIYYNLQDVVSVSADAIMYIIALTNSINRLRTYKVASKGNLPKNPRAREYIEDVGFYSYVSSISAKKTCKITNKRIQIQKGTLADGPIVGDICKFVCNHSSGASLLTTKRLYPMIIELMTNTVQHAYSTNYNGKMQENWYIYVERNGEYVQFVFLDTGVGIPKTIRLNFVEQVSKLLLKDKSDAKFISSALQGAFRTETRAGHRGKGLPGIYEDALTGHICDLSIVSGRGKCTVIDTGEIEETILPTSFEGTLISWKFKLETEKGVTQHGH